MNKTKKNIDEFFNNDSEIDKALQNAVKEALLKHKIAGNPVVPWKDGKILFQTKSCFLLYTFAVPLQPFLRLESIL